MKKVRLHKQHNEIILTIQINEVTSCNTSLTRNEALDLSGELLMAISKMEIGKESKQSIPYIDIQK